MPFISEHILLDLPFHKLPNDSSEISMGGDGYKIDSLDVLGKCLQINEGGHLELTLSQATSFAEKIGQTQQLTVEFWAEINPNADADNRRYLLRSGPIFIWVEGNQLRWFLGGNTISEIHTIPAATGLHHWAIVIQKNGDTADIKVFKDGIDATGEKLGLSLEVYSDIYGVGGEYRGDLFDGYQTYDALTWGAVRNLNIYEKTAEYTSENSSVIIGMSVTYAGGQSFTCGNTSGNVTDSIELAEDEFITQITGRHGWGIDRLKFTTNKGQTLEKGGNGGDPFSVDLRGRVLVGFAGQIDDRDQALRSLRFASLHPEVFDLSSLSSSPDNGQVTPVVPQLLIGGRDKGWTGKLAHLRLWSTALTQPQIKTNMERDVTAHAAFKRATNIDWRFINTDDEPTLYINNNIRKPQFQLEIDNAAQGATLVVPKLDGRASVDNNHFQLIFRQGTIANFLLEKPEDEPHSFLAAIRGRNSGWSVSLSEQNEEECLSFLWIGTDDIEDIELTSGKRLTLWIPRLVAEPGSGSRSSHVMLKYDNLRLDSSTGPKLDGQRLQQINILFPDPSLMYRKPPLEVGVVGAPVVLNNGQETCLTLYIKNMQRDTDGKAAPFALGSKDNAADMTPKFVLEIDALIPTETLVNATGLGDQNDLREASPQLNHDDFEVNKLSVASGNVISWEIVPKSGINSIKADDALILTLKSLKTAAPAGRSVLRLRYKDIEGYGEGFFEIPVDRSPAIPARRVSNNGAGYGLAIGHDPRADNTESEEWQADGEVLPEMLSVKQTGSGSAVCIENTGTGEGLTIVNTNDKSNSTGLNVVQSGKGIAAKFTGGDGVKILINNENDSAGLNVAQSGKGLAAKFTGGSGVEILGNLQLRKLQITDTTSQKGKDEKSAPITTSTSKSSAQINRDLNLYLSLDERDVRDTSGKGRSCNKSGNLQVVPDPQLGNCLKFNGNETILCNGISLANKSFTIQFWAKRQEVNNSDHGWIVGQGSNSRNNGLHIGFRDPSTSRENTLAFGFYGNDANFLHQIHQTDTDWHHWACVYDHDKKERMVFRDGIEVKRQFEIEPYTGSGTFYIGKITFTGKKFKGCLSDVRVHYRALSAADVLLCIKAKLDERKKQLTGQNTPDVHMEKTHEGDLKVSSRIRDKTGEIMPVGAVLPFAGKFPPDGWLLCVGQTVSGEEYNDLSKVLYGEVKPTNEVKVPDYRQKFLAGATGVGDYALSHQGGQASVTLTVDQMPSHNHEINDPKHSHGYVKPSQSGKNRDDADDREGTWYDDTAQTSKEQTGITIQHQGSSHPHENRPPYVALNYIIKY